MNQQPVRLIHVASSLPEPCCAIFPSGVEQEGETTKGRFLLNPSLDIVRSLPEPCDQVLAYHVLPCQEAFLLLRKRKVWVPSYAFRYHFRQQQVPAEVQIPVPREVAQLVKRKKEAKQVLGVARHRLLWVDERILSPSAQEGLLAVLQEVSRRSPRLKVIWVSEKEAGLQSISTISRDKFDEQELWYGADLLLTLGPSDHSLAPLHVQCLYSGIVVLTSGVGDHDEWIRHLFSGIVLDPQSLLEELRDYLLMIADHPTLLLELKRNGQSLLRQSQKNR